METIIKLKRKYIKELCTTMNKLRETDYKALKYAEGEISEADYAPIKNERRKLRQDVNNLRAAIKDLR